MRALLMLFVVVLIFGCTEQKEKTYKIYGHITNLEDCKAYLIRLGSNASESADTLAQSKVENGKFYFEGAVDFSSLVLIKFNKKIRPLRLILENSTIHIKAEKSSTFNAIVVGSDWHDKVYGLIQSDREYVKQKNILIGLGEYAKGLDKEKELEIYKRIDKDFYKANTLMQHQKRKVLDYAIDTCSDIMNKALLINAAYVYRNTEKKKEFFEEFVKKYGEDHYLAKWGEFHTNKIIERKRIEAELKNGKSFKDFTIKDINDKEIKLSDVVKKNNYVLLEFWASWCGPCRAEVPNILKVYNKYKADGFEVFSVSLDNKHEKWAKASKEEKLQWINTCDLKAFEGEIPKMYAITGIPANFLIDSNGIIVAKNLRGEQLGKKLKELFKKK